MLAFMFDSQESKLAQIDKGCVRPNRIGLLKYSVRQGRDGLKMARLSPLDEIMNSYPC